MKIVEPIGGWCRRALKQSQLSRNRGVVGRIGIVKPKWLASKWRGAVIISFILAAIITPTPDPINQSIVAGVLIFLYGISLLLSKLVYREKKIDEEIEASPSE